jgi:hypothetical protein
VKGSYHSHIIELQLVTGCEENDNIKESTNQDEVQQPTNGDEELVKCAGDYHIKQHFPTGVLPRNTE